MSVITTNSLFDISAAFVMHTNRHIFLTGRAGTGKTTFLKHVKENSTKNTVILAPTGVAAINAGGVTMHSFFQLPIGSFIPGRQQGFSLSPSRGTDLQTLLKNLRFNKEKRKLIEELELMVIDEVSMLRADMLDAMDGILRHYRKNYQQPFGGVQMLYIGDMHQLPPVVKDEEWHVLSQYYKSMFFFDAQVMQEASPLRIELDTIYRQSDERFINLLNNIRNNMATEDDLALLNKYYDPYFYPDPDEGFIILTSHNYKADKINQGALAKLNNDTYSFEGTVSGDFNENALPAEKQLTLKAGAQVMFIRNDKGEQRRYYNGKIGLVSRINKDEVYVRFPGEREEMLVEKETWHNIRYQYNESADKIEEEELGAYKQYPLRLAWAVTIHKSQGLTFEKAIIDAGQSFAAGQVYVALSRLTSLNGLVLASEITPEAIRTDERITAFSGRAAPSALLQRELVAAQKEFIAHTLLKSFDFDQLWEAFREHHAGYNEIRLPHQAEAVTWSADMVRVVTELKDVSQKFCNQLRQLFGDTDGGNYGHVQERVKAAHDYFQKAITEQLITSWQAHYDQTKVKNKVKKYMKGLQSLFALLLKKKQQIESAAIMVNGLVEGKNLTHLLQHYQAVARQIPKAASKEAAGAVKEESRSISLQLLQQGKDIDDIAQERGLVRSTIEGHLLTYIVSGEVKLQQLVSKENEVAIRSAIKHATDKQASAIRSVLGDTFSYTEIRAVLCQLERESMM